MSAYPPPSGATVEQGISNLVSSVSTTLRDAYSDCEASVRRSPSKALLAATAAGYILHRLPVRSLLVTGTRIVTALAGPALLAYGAAKTCELLQREARKTSL